MKNVALILTSKIIVIKTVLNNSNKSSTIHNEGT